MNKVKEIVALICLIICHGGLIAQTSKPEAKKRFYIPSNTQSIKELNIGDQVPEVIFDNVLNYKAKTAKLSEFKSELTILDFWSTSCSSCIALFPHMQALKDEFKDRLQIILVNGKTSVWHDDEPKVKNVLSKLEKRTGNTIQLPVVLNSETLDNYFPWVTIPHEVWIDGKGTVLAITGSMEVTAENIRALLEGQRISMHTKKDVSIDLQTHTLSELAYDRNLPYKKPEYSSTLLKGYIDGLSEQGLRHSDTPNNNLYTGLYITNRPLYNIYEFAFQNIINFPANRVIVEASNSSRFSKIYGIDPFIYSNVYSYDISVSPTNYDELLSYVQNDLERIFKTTVKLEKRKINCYIIKASSSLINSYSKGGERIWEIGISSSKKYIHNYSVTEILENLNNFSKTPLIDEAIISNNIDMNLPDNMWDTALLVQSLRSAGFIVTEEQQEMNVVVISDK